MLTLFSNTQQLILQDDYVNFVPDAIVTPENVAEIWRKIER